MMSVDQRASTIDDLYRAEAQTELVDEEPPALSPSAFRHLKIATVIFSYNSFIKVIKRVPANGDGGGFHCDLSLRQSYSRGYIDESLRLADPGNHFSPETERVRAGIQSATVSGSAAELKVAIKGADYFADIHRAVWSIEEEGQNSVPLYFVDQPENAIDIKACDRVYFNSVLPRSGQLSYLYNMVQMR